MSWAEARFGSLFAEPTRNGVMRPKRTRGHGVKMVGMRELFARGHIGAMEMERVPATPEECERFGLCPGDLLFARQSLVAAGAGQCSLVEFVPEPTVFESHLIRVRLDPQRTVPAYYYYYFRSPHGLARMRSIVNHVTAAGIRGSELETLAVPLPPLAVQRRVAAQLSAYDRLIALDQRRIHALETLARKLYSEWFCQFRFPGHASSGRIASRLGPIPAGWEVVPATAVMQVRPPTQVPKDGLKPYVPMAALATNSMVITAVERRMGNSGARFKNGDTLFARITPCLENGKTGFVQFLPTPEATAFGSTEFIVLRGQLFSPQMVYLLARTPSLRAHALRSMSGASGRQRAPSDCFESFELALPPAHLIERFSTIVRPMFSQIEVLGRRMHALAKLRALLAPRLLAGELVRLS